MVALVRCNPHEPKFWIHGNPTLDWADASPSMDPPETLGTTLSEMGRTRVSFRNALVTFALRLASRLRLGSGGDSKPRQRRVFPPLPPPLRLRPNARLTVVL